MRLSPCKRLAGLAAAFVVAGVVAGCGGAPAAEPETAVTPENAVAQTSQLAQVPAKVSLAQSVLDQMTAQQRVGQLLMVSLASPWGSVDDLVAQTAAGSVLLLGNEWQGSELVAGVTGGLAQLPAPAGAGLVIAVDQEGGQIQRLSGPGFADLPSAAVQGTWSADEVREQARLLGFDLAAAGVNADLAPVADVVPPDMLGSNEPVGVLDREFGTEAGIVGQQAAAFARGLHDAGIMAAVKHFPGLGRVVGNTDFTASGITDSLTTADDPYLDAFRDVIAEDPAMVMVSLATYPQIDPSGPAAFSSPIITGLLRGQLGFDGVVITDSLGAEAVSYLPAGERAVRVVEAGGDIAVFTTAEDSLAAAQALLARYETDPAFASTVDAAALRVLEMKDRAGLLG